MAYLEGTKGRKISSFSSEGISISLSAQKGATWFESSSKSKLILLLESSMTEFPPSWDSEPSFSTQTIGSTWVKGQKVSKGNMY